MAGFPDRTAGRVVYVSRDDDGRCVPLELRADDKPFLAVRTGGVRRGLEHETLALSVSCDRVPTLPGHRHIRRVIAALADVSGGADHLLHRGQQMHDLPGHQAAQRQANVHIVRTGQAVIAKFPSSAGAVRFAGCRAFGLAGACWSAAGVRPAP